MAAGITARIGLVVGALWMLWDSAAYFARAPAHLLYVAAIAIVGGLAAAVCSTLPFLLQQILWRWFWGFLVAGLFLCMGCISALFLRFFVLDPSPFYQLGVRDVALVAGYLGVLAVHTWLAWREFGNARKTSL